MGDRALVIFHNKARTEFSPIVYLHCAGSEVPKLVAEVKKFMAGRPDDVEYASARFVGICHANDPESNLSVGIWNSPENAPARDDDQWADYSHGDAGVILVDASDFSVRCFGGYLKQSDFKE